MKIRKGDYVQIVSGNDKGKKGKILAVFIHDEKTTKITVEGVNVRKKHSRPRQQGRKGEIVEKTMPIPMSRVMIVCGKCGKPTRVGYRTEKELKSRICKKCGGEL